MNQTKPTKSSQTSSASSGATASSTSSTTAAGSSPCGCGCHAHAAEPCGCCKLTCFERPKYFCGQLLSDADLTLQETYSREKNKLYHRTMDGFGVVCGLRMRCDGHCKGHIAIGEGYAIDCCGNDLVVCEPRSFDVIGELRKKNWLVENPRDRLRTIREGDDDCIIKQCFYIGICYAEEPLDFATPYTTECNPAPGPCQPTRIRECVRFEIYDKVPARPNPLDRIEKGIECCFKIFREGQFARGLRVLAPRILRVLDYEDKAGEDPEDYQAHMVFEELRAQFLHELRTCPDRYNCNLEHDVCQLHPPRRVRDELGPAPLEAFTRIFELIQKHVFSCVLAQLAFLCPEPPDPCCVLIGSVEIENGRLTRVINYPRWYLWCFANFFEVLIYTLANEAACGPKGRQESPLVEEPLKPPTTGCCPGFEVDVRGFLTLFEAENSASQLAALAPVHAIRAMHKSLVAGFDFMKPGGVVASVFDGLPKAEAELLGRRLGLSIESLDKPPSERRDPLSALLSHLIHRGGDPIAAYESGKDQVLSGATRIMNAPAWPIAQPGAISHQEVAAMAERIKRLEDDLRTLKDSMPNPPPAEGGDGGTH